MKELIDKTLTLQSLYNCFNYIIKKYNININIKPSQLRYKKTSGLNLSWISKVEKKLNCRIMIVKNIIGGKQLEHLIKHKGLYYIYNPRFKYFFIPETANLIYIDMTDKKKEKDKIKGLRNGIKLLRIDFLI